MPRRKKTGQSPARAPGGPHEEGGSLGHIMGYRLPQVYDNFPSSSSISSAAKETIIKSMQEMFSHLDPEVIYIVLSECDFKVENAMDSLLELSVAAEGAAPIPSPVSGFERTAAALLRPGHFSEARADPDASRPSQQPFSPTSTNLLTEELDLLVDQELETLTAQQDIKKEHPSSQCMSAGMFLSSFPPPPFPKQSLPELLQSSLEPASKGPSDEQPCTVECRSGASSPLDQLSTWEDDNTEGQQSVVDFTHLITETPADKLKPPLDLAASGRPSAFQVYKKQDPSHTLSNKAGVLPSEGVVGGARSKVNMLNPVPPGYTSSPWNPDSPVFIPCNQSNQGPLFITPVAQTLPNWPSQPRHATPWLNQGPVRQAPLKPSATIPKSWALPTAPQHPVRHSRLRLEGKVLVLIRGAPGSGKSTLARALQDHNPGGVVLSTDDYFTHHGQYQFDPTALGEAHEWNHKRAKEAFQRGANPIIIDNTNMQCWEMKPYVAQALRHDYKVLFREPDTWWKNKPRELERRTTHNVPVEIIRRMLTRYERYVTVQSIMGSQMPESKQRILLENRSLQPVTSETPCPDLVGQPGLTEQCKKSRPQLFSSLPDVSSIGHSAEVGMLDKSTESLNFQPTERSAESIRVSDGDNLDDMDLGTLDSELDAQLDLNHLKGDQKIPDCIVESVMNEDHRGNERPVAFSESIGQRVRRERPSRRSNFDRMESSDLVKDTNRSESKVKEKENMAEEEAERDEIKGENGMPKMLDGFVGDWPSKGSLEQRQVKRREMHKQGNEKEDGGGAEEVNQNTNKVQSGPNVKEFQKLLDLIQTGGAALQTGSSHSSSLSPSSDRALESEVEEAGSRRSNSEEREQNMGRVNSSRAELPDCVLDWKAADSCVVRESKIDGWEGLKIEKEVSNTPIENDKTGSVDLKSTIQPATDSLAISETVDAKVCHDRGSHNVESGLGTEPGAAGHSDMDTNNFTDNGGLIGVELDGTHVGEVCQSPGCEGAVDTESSTFSGDSQERKHRQGRRSGKQCKLALTFSQNCPASSLTTLQCPTTTVQNVDSSENSCNLDIEPNTTLSFKTNFDLFTKSKSEPHQQSPSPLSLIDMGYSTQTEPQDFALLWRLSRQDGPDDTVVAVCSYPTDITVLSGDSSRFVPELSSAVSAAVAVHPSSHTEVPYRVVHEKGTQVEERDFGATQDRLESLRILSTHFKLVSFDTLEDLYDKCHHNLEWTTNLLLDSGERFFRDEEGREEEEGDRGEDNQNTSNLRGALEKVVETKLSSNVLDELQSKGLPNTTRVVEATQQSAHETVSESGESSDNTGLPNVGGAASDENHPNTPSPSVKPFQTELNLVLSEKGVKCNTRHKVISEPEFEGGAWVGSIDDGVIIEESRIEIEDEIASMDEVNRLLQAELDVMEREAKEKKKEERNESRHLEERRSQHLDIQSVELKLPTELALQLTELFGPVGIDPGTCSSDDYVLHMDLNLAKLLHQKWKESIQERQRQATLSFHLLKESSMHWGEPQVAKHGTRDRMQASRFLLSTDGYASQDSQPESHGGMPFMDHWNVSRPHVSLRDIIKEEQALQQNVEKTRQNRAELDRRDGATLLKENQLYSLFPTIDRHFLQDIFRDHNYSLAQTQLFLQSLLDEEPVKTVVAPEAPRSDHHRAASKEREKRQKPLESAVLDYQDTEDPEYDDFRAEASLQRSRQIESFTKAAEAYKQGRKEVASFYAQQGHLHGQRMREANHRAAVQIFERVNASLLPRNILDLHGLHVDEALEHLAQVLHDKISDCEQGLCRPQLSIITGRGNHSQGGVARIRPAVIDYLTNRNYRFTEPKQGLVLVFLK
ncbi:NEDD4-binding protein 2 isoform X1 [Scomber japonicus]|uniref:NEDD4-binding protein 2 isoform X1 n=1 Tax=Scomber japonicus TaxID=13676 RepID=UPI002306B3EF|nr:NEDD4-binding protein 2 isoform X1 [Scomber japonicus]